MAAMVGRTKKIGAGTGWEFMKAHSSSSAFGFQILANVWETRRGKMMEASTCTWQEQRWSNNIAGTSISYQTWVPGHLTALPCFQSSWWSLDHCCWKIVEKQAGKDIDAVSHLHRLGLHPDLSPGYRLIRLCTRVTPVCCRKAKDEAQRFELIHSGIDKIVLQAQDGN